MRKLISIAILSLLALPVFAGTFYTNTSTRTLDLENLSSDFNDFRFTFHGYEDQYVKYTITTNGGGIDLDGRFAIFKASRRVSGGSNIVYLALNTSQITVSTSNITFTVAHTNIPPNATYNAELLLLNSAATNITKTAGRGTITVEDSLFDDDDGSWSNPNLTNLVNYLTKAEAATNYLAVATNSRVNGYILTASGANQYWSSAGSGDFLAAGTVAMTGDLNHGGFDATNIGQILGVNTVTVDNALSVGGSSVLTSEVDTVQTVVNRDATSLATNFPSITARAGTTQDFDRVETTKVYWDEDGTFATYDEYSGSGTERRILMKDGTTFAIIENGDDQLTITDSQADFGTNAVLNKFYATATNHLANKAYVDAVDAASAATKAEKTNAITGGSGINVTGGTLASTDNIVSFDTTFGDTRYVTSDTNIYDELIVAKADSLGSELIINGTFTNGNFWVFTNASWQSGGTYDETVCIAAGAIGSLSPSNAIAIVTGSTYQVSFICYSFGDSVTNTFIMGGKTSVVVNTTTTTNTFFHPVANIIRPLLRVQAGATYTVYVDTLSVKKAQSGDAWIANNLGVGGDGKFSGDLFVGGDFGVGGTMGFNRITADTGTITVLQSDTINLSNELVFTSGSDGVIRNVNNTDTIFIYAGATLSANDSAYISIAGTEEPSGAGALKFIAGTNGIFQFQAANSGVALSIATNEVATFGSNVLADAFIGNGWMCEQTIFTNGVQAISLNTPTAITNWRANVTDAGFTRTATSIVAVATGRYTVDIELSFTAASAALPECHLYVNNAVATDAAGQAAGWSRGIGAGGSGTDGYAGGSLTLTLTGGDVVQWRIEVPANETLTYAHGVFRIKRQ